MDQAGQMALGSAPGERADALLAELGYADWRAGQRLTDTRSLLRGLL